MDPVDYGPANPDMVQAVEQMRAKVEPEKRLLLMKLFARTLEVDGDPAEKRLAYHIDTLITAHFKTKYPQSGAS